MDRAIARAPNEEIVDHNRRREIEVKLVEIRQGLAAAVRVSSDCICLVPLIWRPQSAARASGPAAVALQRSTGGPPTPPAPRPCRDEYETKGYSEEEIEELIAAKRKELEEEAARKSAADAALSEWSQRNGAGVGSGNMETHALAERKQRQMDNLRSALGFRDEVCARAAAALTALFELRWTGQMIFIPISTMGASRLPPAHRRGCRRDVPSPSLHAGPRGRGVRPGSPGAKASGAHRSAGGRGAGEGGGGAAAGARGASPGEGSQTRGEASEKRGEKGGEEAKERGEEGGQASGAAGEEGRLVKLRRLLQASSCFAEGPVGNLAAANGQSRCMPSVLSYTCCTVS